MPRAWSANTVTSLAAIALFLGPIGILNLVMSEPKHHVTGNDISFPQCGQAFPAGQSFGVVGVNGGVPTDTNPCLAEQLRWASQSRGDGIGQPPIQLYVNTANPGQVKNAPGWPNDNLGLFNTPSPNPFGACDGSNSLACSWQYGWNRAVEAVHLRFAPAARQAGLSEQPNEYTWWLDVETLNSWQSRSGDGFRKNTATLEGMVDYYSSVGARTGIYSTSYQLGKIMDKPTKNSNLNNLDSWLAGALDAEGAKQMCTMKPLTPSGRVVMVQYVKDDFDFNYSCL